MFAETLDVVSEPGDFVGEGLTYHYGTTGGATFTATADALGAIRTEYQGPTGDGGTPAFIPPKNQLFIVGATCAVEPSVIEPTMVDINNRGRGFVPGWFTVEDIADLRHGSFDRFAASFEQHCKGAVEDCAAASLSTSPAGTDADRHPEHEDDRHRREVDRFGHRARQRDLLEADVRLRRGDPEAGEEGRRSVGIVARMGSRTG